MVRYKYFYALISLLLPLFLFPQSSDNGADNVFVDAEGVLRWKPSGEEIHGFGVNYTVPFAHAYKMAKRMGIDHRKAIDQDVYHFKRLGFDFYRIHVWDTEISDTLGNLLENEHLELFDYLLYKLGENEINYIITPIAFWGGGWPEPDVPTPGFSYKYGKQACLTDPEAIRAQANYLKQFVQHINTFTKVSYRNDPRLIAIEVSNEPHHREDGKTVTAFVNTMVDGLRQGGWKKPVFYNVSHSVHLAEDYFNANIKGGTFQWYPTGLLYDEELQGNFLPNVDRYVIPFDSTIRNAGGAKIVYEFDAADLNKSYMYPPMARSFRTAGIQLAAHFSYDPMFMSHFNTEYNTHYMNLAFTPRKALALAICAEVFRTVPRYADYGTYPGNINFGHVRIDQQGDCVVFNSEDKYLVTNHTDIEPINESALNNIKGWGNNTVVQYSGTGAYFLDKLRPGVWRLEVMPDVLVTSNTFGRNAPDRPVAHIRHAQHTMTVTLSDLGQDFSIHPLSVEKVESKKASSTTLTVKPGAYILASAFTVEAEEFHRIHRTADLMDFHAPATSVDAVKVVHVPVNNALANMDLTIDLQALAAHDISRVQAYVTSTRNWQLIDLHNTHGHNYTGVIPADLLNHGFLTYYLVVHQGNSVVTFPAGKNGWAYDWDFYERTPYRVRVIPENYPVVLFDAESDRDKLTSTRWSRGSKLVPSTIPKISEYQVVVNGLLRTDNENLRGEKVPDYTIKCFVNDKVDHMRESLGKKKHLVINGRSLMEKACPVQVALTDAHGVSFGAVIHLQPGDSRDYFVDLEAMKPVKTVLMPRPYPTFLPYYFEHEMTHGLDVSNIEGVQISLGVGIPAAEYEESFSFGVTNIRLE